jgi:hypothetical protein
MSILRARQTINLKKTDKIAQWENISNEKFLCELTGIDSKELPREALIKAYELLDIDFALPLPAKGANSYLDRNDSVQFLTVDDPEEVYAFDPYNIPCNTSFFIDMGVPACASLSERTDFFQRKWKDSHDEIGDSVMVPVCSWYTLFHAFFVNFGYEATAIAAYSEPERFRDVVERIFEVSLKKMEAFAQTDAELALCHDDLAMSDRTIFPPDWYREYIFPWYKELWKPLKKAGKKVLFFSDGKIDDIMGDLVETGADGLFIDTCASLEKAQKQFSGRIFLLGNADCRIISEGSREDIYREVERCTRVGKNSNGYILNVSGHIMNEIPLENLKAYFEYASLLR